MDLDSQSIEKRDFPISRRGYDPAAVDAHLRALADEVQELQRTLEGQGPDSLAVSAGTQVQSIVAAAEAAATEIERQAQANAQSTREGAESDAATTRAEAVAQAQAQVAAVGQATATLLSRVQSMDSQVAELVERLQAGAGGLAGDLDAVEANMGELYDAAAGRRAEASTERNGSGARPQSPSATPPPPATTTRAAPASGRPAEAPAPTTPSPAPVAGSKAPAVAGHEAGAHEGGEYDARLAALNMALNGDSREETERFIAENYEVADRKKLLDEVFAAIEG